jgi:putative addiction module killer protein
LRFVPLQIYDDFIFFRRSKKVNVAKIRYGAGFRMYFINKGIRIIVLLCGGDKSTQKRDIEKAKKMTKEI